MNQTYRNPQSSWASTILQLVKRELLITWGFNRSNIFDSIGLNLSFFITACLYTNNSWNAFSELLFYSFIYALLFTYTFCLSNQVNSVAEDSLNKTYRPLVTKIITREGTIKRIFIVNLIFLAYSYYLGLEILFISIIWIIISIWHNLLGGSKHWFLKNVILMGTLGTAVPVIVQWLIVIPFNQFPDNFIAYTFLMCLWGGAGLSVQDMRDKKGDKMLNRKTLPTQYGENNARYILCVVFTIICPALLFIAILSQYSIESIFSNNLFIFVVGLELLIHWILAYRIIFFKTRFADIITYYTFVAQFIISFNIILIK